MSVHLLLLLLLLVGDFCGLASKRDRYSSFTLETRNDGSGRFFTQFPIIMCVKARKGAILVFFLVVPCVLYALH